MHCACGAFTMICACNTIPAAWHHALFDPAPVRKGPIAKAAAGTALLALR